MRRISEKLTAGFLSLVLAMCVLILPASAEEHAPIESDEGIAPQYVECPSCGDIAVVSTTWQNEYAGEYAVPCAHYRFGSDVWAYRVGQTMERCTNPNCGWYITYEIKTPVYLRCAGSM